MTDNASHIAPADRHNLAPCADPLHQHAVAEAAELRRLVSALVSNACSRDLAAALRSLNEGRKQPIDNAGVLAAIGCTCAPGDGSGNCEREQACHVAWLDETARRRAADEGERQFEREWEAAEFRAAYEGSGG